MTLKDTRHKKQESRTFTEFVVKCKEITSLAKRNFNRTYVWQANTEKTLEIRGEGHENYENYDRRIGMNV